MGTDVTKFVVALAADNPPIEGDPGSIFTMYGCGLYAAALHRHDETLGFVVAGEPECLYGGECVFFGETTCQCMANHVYAYDGTSLYDIYGEHDPDGISEFWTLRPLSPLAMLVLLETWYGEDGEAAEVAALALYLTSWP